MVIFRQQWMACWALTILCLASIPGDALAADYRPLVGRWQRTDGGYVVEIRRVAADGTMDADYFNPRPINVARANAAMFKGHLKVDIELRDAGYPGSTYTLLYDPAKDALLGLYYQAFQRHTYDVVFVRTAVPK